MKACNCPSSGCRPGWIAGAGTAGAEVEHLAYSVTTRQPDVGRILTSYQSVRELVRDWQHTQTELDQSVWIRMRTWATSLLAPCPG